VLQYSNSTSKSYTFALNAIFIVGASSEKRFLGWYWKGSYVHRRKISHRSLFQSTWRILCQESLQKESLQRMLFSTSILCKESLWKESLQRVLFSTSMLLGTING